jgi:hypothetical protein
MDTLEKCRRFVASIQAAARRRDSAAARRLADDLRASPPEVAYASVTAALRSSYCGFRSDIPTERSRWIEAHFLPVVREALRDRMEGRR